MTDGDGQSATGGTCTVRRLRAGRLLAAALACVLAATGWLPTSALATPSVTLHVALSPEIPGHSTTVRLRIQMTPAGELLPPPLIGAQLSYPAGLDIQLSGLGIDACSISTLEAHGPRGCPANSLVGDGRAIAELPIKGEVVREAAQIVVVRSTEQEGHPAFVLYVYNETALSAEIPLRAALLPAAKPYGGTLDIQVPLVPTFPEGPYVSVSEIQLVLGPQGITYYEHAGGKILPYKPRGIPLPGRCPKGGFRFGVQLSFLGGASAGDTTPVPCPARSRQRAVRPARLRHIPARASLPPR